MTSLALNELKLIAQYRNISDYQNKSKEDLIKALSKPKPKPKTGINKKKLEEIRKDFYKLRHKFSKKESNKYVIFFFFLQASFWIRNRRDKKKFEWIRKKFNV